MVSMALMGREIADLILTCAAETRVVNRAGLAVQAAACMNACGRPGVAASAEYRAHEAAFVRTDTGGIQSVAIGRRAFDIVSGLFAVALVGRQRVEAEQRISDIIGAFMRQEIAVVAAAKAFLQPYPEPCVVLERVDFVRPGRSG